MTRTLFTWTLGAWLLACSSTTRIHMEKIEENGGAAGEASTTGDEATTGNSSTSADSADDAAGTTSARGGGSGGVGNGR